MVTSKCTASAIAIVKIIMGADMTGGDNNMPDQPASPIAVAIDIMIMIKVATVPLKPRNKTYRVSTIKPSASG